MVFSIEKLIEIEEQKKKSLEETRLVLLEETRRILGKVLSEFHAEEVYITGSLVYSGRFHSGSDIDIAIKGLKAEDYFKLLAILNELLPRNVEIIELENCRFNEKIRKTGLRIK